VTATTRKWDTVGQKGDNVIETVCQKQFDGGRNENQKERKGEPFTMRSRKFVPRAGTRERVVGRMEREHPQEGDPQEERCSHIHTER